MSLVGDRMLKVGWRSLLTGRPCPHPSVHPGVDETGAAPIVRVEVEVPPTDRRIGPGDPLVGVPCL